MLNLLLLMRADQHASTRVAAAGAEGARQQVAAIEAIGGNVRGQWALLGRYDLAVVASFPDEAIAAAYCLAASAAGFATEAHVALAPAQLAAAQSLFELSRTSDADGSPPEPEVQATA